MIRRVVRALLRGARAPASVLPSHEPNAARGPAAATAMASFTLGLAYDAIPAPAVHQAKRLLLLGIAWSLLGSRRRESAALATGMLSAPDGCTVIGRKQRFRPADAAFLNAAHAQVYDCNDGFADRGSFHPGRVLVSTALAAAEASGAAGRELLCALVVGYEIARRAFSGRPRTRPDAIAAAAIAGRLLGLTETQTIHAMMLSDQHGPKVYPGPDNFHADANDLCTGWIARAAVESALQARAGLTAHPFPDTIAIDAPLPAAGSGAPFEIIEVYIKPFIACRSCHAAIELALEFRKANPGDVARIERIDARAFGCADFVEERAPAEGGFKAAQFSLPYTVACALLDGDVGEAQYDARRLAAPDVRSLQEKTFATAVRGPDSPHPAAAFAGSLRIALRDGRVSESARAHPKGAPSNPLSDDEVVALFKKWTGPTLSTAAADDLAALAFGIDRCDDVRNLTARLRAV
jgi:2-methylcitrate dehydratase PrpD